MHSIVGNAPAIFCLGTRLDFVFVISLLGSSLYRVTGSGDTVTRMPYFRPPPFDKTSCSAAVAGCTPVVYQPGELKVVVCKNGKERDLAKDDPTVRAKSWQPITGIPPASNASRPRSAMHLTGRRWWWCAPSREGRVRSGSRRNPARCHAAGRIGHAAKPRRDQVQRYSLQRHPEAQARLQH